MFLLFSLPRHFSLAILFSFVTITTPLPKRYTYLRQMLQDFKKIGDDCFLRQYKYNNSCRNVSVQCKYESRTYYVFSVTFYRNFESMLQELPENLNKNVLHI